MSDEIDFSNYVLTGVLPMDSPAMQRLKARADAAQQRIRAQHAAQLDLFPRSLSEQTHWIAPNALVRSALFNCWDRSSEHATGTVYTYENTLTLVARGPALNQHDYDVFELLLNVASAGEVSKGSRFSLTKYAMLKGLAWPASQQYYKRLDDSLFRLAQLNLNLTISPCKLYPSGFQFVGSLISLGRTTEHMGNNGPVSIGMNDLLTHFFKDGCYHHENVEQRRALGKRMLAKALHSFYSSHQKPIPIGLETLHNLLNSTQDAKHFKTSLTGALDALVGVGFLANYRFETCSTGTRLHVERDLAGDYRILELYVEPETSPAHEALRQVKKDVADLNTAVAHAVKQANAMGTRPRRKRQKA